MQIGGNVRFTLTVLQVDGPAAHRIEPVVVRVRGGAVVHGEIVLIGPYQVGGAGLDGLRRCRIDGRHLRQIFYVRFSHFFWWN